VLELYGHDSVGFVIASMPHNEEDTCNAITDSPCQIGQSTLKLPERLVHRIGSRLPVWSEDMPINISRHSYCQRSLKIEPKRSPKSEPVRRHYCSTAPTVTDGRFVSPELRSR
jgi:hypothetical protein